MAVTVSPTTLAKGAKRDFYDQYHKPISTDWQRIQMTTTSDGPSENYPWLGALPQVEEWLTERTVHALDSTGFLVENKEWESTIAIRRVDQEDDRSRNNSWTLRVQQMATQVQTFRWSYALAFLTNGTSITAAYGSSYDGVAFFSNNHASGSNIIAPAADFAGTPFMDTTAIRAFTGGVKMGMEVVRDLADAALDAMGQQSDGRGGYYDETSAADITFIVPMRWKKFFEDALAATLIANDSVTGYNNIFVFGTPRLSSALNTGNQLEFYVMRTDRPIKPLGWQERLAVEFDDNMDGDVYWSRGEYQLGVRFRGRGFYGPHEYAVLCRLGQNT